MVMLSREICPYVVHFLKSHSAFADFLDAELPHVEQYLSYELRSGELGCT